MHRPFRGPPQAADRRKRAVHRALHWRGAAERPEEDTLVEVRSWVPAGEYDGSLCGLSVLSPEVSHPTAPKVERECHARLCAVQRAQVRFQVVEERCQSEGLKSHTVTVKNSADAPVERRRSAPELLSSVSTPLLGASAPGGCRRNEARRHSGPPRPPCGGASV